MQRTKPNADPGQQSSFFFSEEDASVIRSCHKAHSIQNPFSSNSVCTGEEQSDKKYRSYATVLDLQWPWCFQWNKEQKFAYLWRYSGQECFLVYNDWQGEKNDIIIFFLIHHFSVLLYISYKITRTSKCIETDPVVRTQRWILHCCFYESIACTFRHTAFEIAPALFSFLQSEAVLSCYTEQ